MKNLVADTIGKIKNEKIRPEPRWKYLAKKYSTWISFFTAALVGAAVFSVAYFLVSQLDWDLYAPSHRYSLFYYFSLIPYLWVIPLVILVFLAFLSLRKTESGYKYDFSKITLAVLGSLIFLGLLLAFSGFGGKINAALTRDFPGYGRLVTTKESQWSQPEKGLLAGTIDTVSKSSIGLQDFSGKEWQINTDEKTIVRPSVNLESGQTIKVIGQEEGSRAFKASEIRPWQRKGKIQKGNGSEMQGGMGNGRRK